MRLSRGYMEKQVKDPILRAKLTPQYKLGCKRVLLSDDFYPTLTQSNVEVITDRIREVRTNSIVTEDGLEHEIDAIIFGTGFHVTDSQLPQYIHGRDGQSLADHWHAGSSAYLGTTVSGFPNLFLLIGPNTGLGHNSMVFMIESQLNYVLECLHTMDRRNLGAVEVRPEIQEAFDTEMQKRMQHTVWTSGCKSWYLDANGHNTTLWPGFTFEYRRRTRHFDPQYYNVIPQKLASTHKSGVQGTKSLAGMRGVPAHSSLPAAEGGEKIAKASTNGEASFLNAGRRIARIMMSGSKPKSVDQ